MIDYKKHIKEYQDFPIEGVKYYDLNELEEKVFMANVSSFSINYKNSNILVKSGQSVRLLSTKAVFSLEKHVV